jgi:hypothetical protein
MRYSKDDIVKELEYIETNFDFSPHCSVDMQTTMFRNGLVEDVDGCIMTTYEGDILLGKDSEELRSIYDEAEGFFYHTDEEGDEDECL